VGVRIEWGKVDTKVDEKRKFTIRKKCSIYRYLGCIEYLNVREERAVKHLIIASTLGCSRSVDKLKIMYQLGDVT